MGQTSNILTLRKKELNQLNMDSKVFVYEEQLLQKIKQSLKIENIIVSESFLNLSENLAQLTVTGFVETKKLSEFKRNTSLVLQKANAKGLFKDAIYKTLLPSNSIYIEKPILKIKLIILNTYLSTGENKLKLKKLYISLKLFTGILFTRRFNLFIDFLKITLLFSELKINPTAYLNLLGKIFKVLQKRSHNKFVFFLKKLFTFIIRDNSNTIKGVKFIINGRIQGKPRANSTKILLGRVPTQTISANIKFAKTHVYTLYGAFGFKIWLHY